MVFDLFVKLQSAPLHEQGSAKQSNFIRSSIRRLRESLIARERTTAAEPMTSDVSRDLALQFLLSNDDNKPL